MATTRVISNEFQKYINNLPATNVVCSALGTSLTFGTNLFVDVEPAIATQMITIIPFSGGPPANDRYKYEGAVQIRVKANSVQKSLETSQALINILHGNTVTCASQPGKVYADQSTPFILEVLEGGKWVISVANYTIRHIKLS